MMLGHGGLLASRSLGLARGATLPYPRQRRQLSGSGGGPLDRLGDLVRARVGIKEDDGMYGTGLGEGPGLSEGSPLLNWNLEEIKTSPGLGFGFSAGGLLFPYFVGNAVALKRLGLVNSETVFAGSSAGSLISACLVCDLEADELMDNLLRVSVTQTQTSARKDHRHNCLTLYLSQSTYPCPRPRRCIASFARRARSATSGALWRRTPTWSSRRTSTCWPAVG